MFATKGIKAVFGHRYINSGVAAVALTVTLGWLPTTAQAACIDDSTSGITATAPSVCTAAQASYTYTTTALRANAGASLTVSDPNVHITTNGAANSINITNAWADGAGAKIDFTKGDATDVVTLVSTGGTTNTNLSRGNYGLWGRNGGQVTGGDFDITMAGNYSAAVYAVGDRTEVTRGSVDIGNLTAVINNRGYGIRAYQGGTVTAGLVDITASSSVNPNVYGILVGGDDQNYPLTPDSVTIAGGTITVTGYRSSSGIWAGSAGTVTVTGNITISTTTTSTSLLGAGGSRGIDISNNATVNLQGNTTITTDGGYSLTASSSDGIVIGSNAGISGGTVNSYGQMNVHTIAIGAGLRLNLDGGSYNANYAKSSSIFQADKGNAIVFEVGSGTSADINRATLTTGAIYDLVVVRSGATKAVLSLHNSNNVVANSAAALVNQTSTGSFTFNADNTQMQGAIVTTAGSTEVNLANNSVWTLAPRGANAAVRWNNTLSTLNIDSGSTLEASGGNFFINGPGGNPGNLTTAKVNNNAGTINLYNATAHTGSILTIGGDWTQGSAGTLNILGDNGSAKMVTNNATLGGTLNIFEPYLTMPAKASLVGNEQIHVVRSNNAIAGDFDLIQTDLTTPDYLYYAGHKTNSDLNYDVGLAMSWFRGATLGHGTFTLPDPADTFEVDLPLPDQAASATGWDGTTLTKQGAGTLILSAAHAYTGATEINGGHVLLQGPGDIAPSTAVRLNVAAAVLDMSGIDAVGATLQNLSGVADSQLIRANKEVTLANSMDTTFAGDFDASTATLIKTGTGVLTLSGQTRWTGQTQIEQGTLVLDGSRGYARLNSNVGGDHGAFLALQNSAVLTGWIQEPGLSIDGPSVWNMTASSTVASLTHAGLINIAPPERDGFKTVTVLQGNYIGQGGTIAMSTFLGADDSPSDKLVINGGNASGASWLRIANAGGPGAQTISDGILVVDAINGGTTTPGAFALAGRAVAGAYEYDLYRGGIGGNANNDNWYLRTLTQPDPDSPSPGPTPKPSPRPEAYLYARNMAAASGMFVHTLHDRLGEPQYTEAYRDKSKAPQDDKAPAGWVRIVGSHADSQSGQGRIDLDTDTTLIHFGGDIGRWNDSDDNRYHLGLMGGYGKSDIDASSNDVLFTNSGIRRQASGDVEGHSVGVYGTWYGNDKLPEGPYVDVWALYGWYDNTVEGNGLVKEKYDSKGWTASIEGGYALIARDEEKRQWIIEPQMQLAYTNFKAENHREANGTWVNGSDANGVTGRLGTRFYSRSKQGDNGMQPFVEGNIWYSDAKNSMRFDGIRISDGAPTTTYELKLGAQGEIKRNWQLWGHISGRWGQDNYERYVAMIGTKYMF